MSLQNRIPGHLRRTATYLATIVVTQAVAFLLLPVITRFLGPEAYGTYALALAVGNLLAMFGTSWIRNVGFRLYYDAVEAGSTRAFYLTVVLVQGVIVAVLFTGAALISALLPDPWLPVGTLLAAGVMMLAGDLLAMSVGVLRAEQRSGSFAFAEGSAALARFGGTLAGLLLGARSPEFLFLAAAAASTIGAVMAIASMRNVLVGPAGFQPEVLAELGRRLLSAMPFSVGEWLHTAADRIVLEVFTTRTVLGVYAAGHALGDRLVGSLVMAVFMMSWPDTLAAWNRGGTAAARVAVHRQLTLFLWLTVGPLAILVVHAASVVQLLGGGFQEAVRVIPWVATASWVRGLGNGFNRHFELQKRYWTMSAMTLGGAAVNVSLNLYLVPRHGAVGAAVATLIAQSVVTLAFVVTRDRDLVDFPFLDAGLVLGVTVMLAALTWWWLGPTIAGMLVLALSYAVVTVAVWVMRLRHAPQPVEAPHDVA